MKVSLVMAVYNGEKYLIEQLDSIRKQTYLIDEVILIYRIDKNDFGSVQFLPMNLNAKREEH